MFQFPGCPSLRLWIHLRMTGHYSRRVSPFGYPRFVACLRLPVAFRSLPRPSSAYGALASTLRSYWLDFFVAFRPETNCFSLLYHLPRFQLSLSAQFVCNWPFPFKSFLAVQLSRCKARFRFLSSFEDSSFLSRQVFSLSTKP